MRVIIIGAGKIGFNIAKVLVDEKHDVTVIEKNEERAKNLMENLDLQVVVGNAASSSVLREAGIEEADLLVAVTEIDEVNMIACMLAKNFKVEKTVARVRNPEYLDDNPEQQHKRILPGIDLVINPELVTAKEIAKLIDVPEALDVLYYGKGQIQMLELKITAGAPVADKYLRDLNFNYPYLIIAVSREGKMLIPRGDDQLLVDDIIFIMAKTKEMVRIERLLGTERERASRVMILGGGFTGFHLAEILEEKKYHVTLIEKDYKRCLDLSNRLQTTLVIHGDATDIDLLKAENTEDVDVFVCLTDDDKLNLLVSLIVKNLGTKKTIAQVRRSDYIGLMQSVGIDAGVSPRTLTANAILRFISRGNSVLSVAQLGNESAEMLEMAVPPESKMTGKKLKDLNFPRGAIIGSIFRENLVIIPKGEDVLLPGDLVTVFILPKMRARIIEYFSL